MGSIPFFESTAYSVCRVPQRAKGSEQLGVHVPCTTITFNNERDTLRNRPGVPLFIKITIFYTETEALRIVWTVGQ